MQAAHDSSSLTRLAHKALGQPPAFVATFHRALQATSFISWVFSRIRNGQPFGFTGEPQVPRCACASACAQVATQRSVGGYFQLLPFAAPVPRQMDMYCT